MEERSDFRLLGADAVNRSCVTFGCKRYRWDLVVLHVPSQKIGVLEVDGEQHFFGPEWEVNHERDVAKRKLILSDLPPCAERIDFLIRISYDLRRRGRGAIKDLLDLVGQTLEGAAGPPPFFVCLPQDAVLYTVDGVPVQNEATHGG